MIIDRTYFTGPLVIPQLGSIPVQDTVDGYIIMHEPVVLSKALGEGFYQELLAGLGEDPINQKWLDILDGVTFTNVSGHVYKWRGLTPAGQIPGGPVAAFIWFHYTRDTALQNSGVGVVLSQSENAVNVSPSFKMSAVWNSISADFNLLWQFLNANQDIYTGWNRSLVCYSYFGKINQFGI